MQGTGEDAATAYGREGYALVRGLFTAGECAAYRDHYMALRAEGPRPGDHAGVDLSSSDPLRKFPRMIHMHRWDQTSRDWLLSDRLYDVLTALVAGVEPWAVQTMLYFKPPRARGQALHQDQYYFRIRPGTSVAAWMALDPSDEETGCIQVVPGTQGTPVLCTRKADTTRSFTDVEVPLPDGLAPLSVEMEPGDVLFFNGSIVHGSGVNRSPSRFRRALIGHYITGDAEKVAEWYRPIWRRDGSEVVVGNSELGGPCGVWVDRSGAPSVELAGRQDLHPNQRHG